MSDKIGSHHLQRRAILYVRQSSSHQAIHNEESRRLQYAMRGRLRDLGWQEITVGGSGPRCLDPFPNRR